MKKDHAVIYEKAKVCDPGCKCLILKGGAYTTQVVIRNVIITLMTLEGCLHADEVLFFPHFSLFCDM